MALTTVSKTDALRKLLWEKKLYDNIMKDTFFNRFTSKDKNSIVWQKEDFKKSLGDKMYFGIRTTKVEDHAGVTGRATLEGNEVQLETGDFYVELERYRQGVRHSGSIDEQRAAYSLNSVEEAFLKEWFADKLDTLHFDACYSSPTNVIYNNAGTKTFTTSAATGIAGVDATNSKLTPALISYTKMKAKSGNSGGIFRIAPIKVNGMDWYVLVVSPAVMYDLRSDSTMTNAQRDAMARGKDNPLFRGGDLIWDGVIITESERIQTGISGVGGAVPYSENLFLGKNSLVRADGKKMQMSEKMFDYEGEVGKSIELFTAIGKAKFDSVDYGIIDLVTANS